MVINHCLTLPMNVTCHHDSTTSNCNFQVQHWNSSAILEKLNIAGKYTLIGQLLLSNKVLFCFKQVDKLEVWHILPAHLQPVRPTCKGKMLGLTCSSSKKSKSMFYHRCSLAILIQLCSNSWLEVLQSQLEQSANWNVHYLYCVQTITSISIHNNKRCL